MGGNSFLILDLPLSCLLYPNYVQWITQKNSQLK